MNKHTIIALVVLTTIMSACNKQDRNYEVNCEPVEIPTYGYGTSLVYNMKPTDSRNCLMRFYNDHSYPVKFHITFPDMPAGITATIQQNDFSLTETKEFINYVTLTATNAAPGFYEIPVVVSTDINGEMGTSLLQVTISDINVVNEDVAPSMSYVWK
ncbi:MAG: hypothetical protein K8F30_06495 [Taibaiella sp.]|nr:hypothetical protein [Taibaiella sp.]